MIKLLALGALLVVAAYAGSFEQRIERHTRLPKANTKGLVRPQWMTVRRQRAQRFVSGRFSSGAQPIINYYDDFYLGNISIGSPDQGPFTVVLDTSSAYLWVIDSLCQDDACEGYPSSGYDKHRFNLSASTTAEPTGELFSVEYRIGSAVGYLIEDDVDLGGLRAQNVTFGSALSISDVFGYVAVDGVLGLGWPEFSEDGIALPPLFQILDQLDAPIFTVWLDRHQKYSAAGAGGGQITYGALDAVNCDAQVDYVPLTSLDAWQFKIDYFTVGEFSLPHPAQVLSDTTSSWLGLRTDLFQGLVRETGAKYDFLQDLYTVNCDAKSLPDLVFSIGGKEYNVSSKDYVLDLDLGSNECALAAYDIGQPGFGATSPAVILGDVFIRAYCNVYDIGEQRIGFAKAHHKEN